MKTASRVTSERGVTLASLTLEVPPLQSGDRLSAAEFMRRYNLMPRLQKAELIEGVVYMSSAVSVDHGGPHAVFMAWLGSYWVSTPGTQVLDNTTVLLDLGQNCPQPDACLRIVPECGGQSKTSTDRYVQGAPEFGGEIAATTASYDLHDKLRAYQRNGVREYVVWCVEDRSIEWFVLRGDEYRKLQHRRGVFKSKVFPGLWLDGIALLQGDMVKVLKVLQKGLKSDAHRRFVARLAKQKTNGERGP